MGSAGYRLIRMNSFCQRDFPIVDLDHGQIRNDPDLYRESLQKSAQLIDPDSTSYVTRNIHHRVIRTFRCKETEALFNRQRCPRFRSIENVARRKLALNNAQSLQDLRVPPGNRLEELVGDRQGQHRIRVNDQWRICLVWHDRDACEVEIVDYH